jgi:hypothetical protein
VGCKSVSLQLLLKQYQDAEHRAHPEGRFRRKLRRVYSHYALPIDQREVNIADKILIPKE